MSDAISDPGRSGKSFVGPDALRDLSSQCERAADFVESQFFTPTDDSVAVADHRWSTEQGWKDAPAWIGTTTASYLSEAARLTRSVAGVLGAAIEPPTSVYLLARGVVERVGRMIWILVGEDPERRCVRGAFEHTVCHQFYAKAAERLKASKDDRASATSDFNRMQDWLEQHTSVVKPPQLTAEEKANAKTWHYPDPTDVSTWMVNGEPYPAYGAVTKLAIQRGGTEQSGGALYAALSGFSHPNVIFANEYRVFDGDGRIQFGSSFHSYDVAARLAAIVLLVGAQAVADYSSTEPAVGLRESAEEVSSAFDAIAARFGGD